MRQNAEVGDIWHSLSIRQHSIDVRVTWPMIFLSQRDIAMLPNQGDLFYINNLDEEEMERMLDAFEKEIDSKLTQENQIRTNKECYQTIACYLTKNPSWSDVWRKVLALIKR